MYVTSYATCGPPGVQAYNVQPGQYPKTAMHQEALRICPLGYDWTGTSQQGSTITWTIQCHVPVSQANIPLASC
jgi:hypothetical protein